jgi:hypothetical protein
MEKDVVLTEKGAQSVDVNVPISSTADGNQYAPSSYALSLSSAEAKTTSYVDARASVPTRSLYS